MCIFDSVSFVPSSFRVESPLPNRWLGWSAPAEVIHLSWDASTSSVQVFLSDGRRPVCRYNNLASDAERHAMTRSLRLAKETGVPISLGTAGGWSADDWFCAIRFDESFIK